MFSAAARSVAGRLLRPGLQGTARLPTAATAGVQRRWLSGRQEEAPDSHDDFKPRVKATEEAPSVLDHIDRDVKSNPVMVFMKGVPDAPQCGFSAMVVRILDHMGVEYKARNVLADDELRQAIKKYSDWPTVPQVYVNGEFVGGSDILVNMAKSGELEELLKSVQPKGNAAL